MSVVELGDAYREWAEGYYAKNGVATGHVYLIRRGVRALRELYGRTLAREFGPQKLRAVRQHFVDADCARTYINKVGAEVRRVFKWGVSHELVPSSVYEALRTVDGLKRGRTSAREPQKVGPVEDAIVDATIPFLPPVVADMVCLQRLTGCRPGELCILRPCDVNTSEKVWCYTPESHKTEHHGRERRIFIGPKAQDILRPYLLRDHQSHCFSPSESRRKQFEAMRKRRKSKVQPSQVDRRKRRPATQPGGVYTKDSYRRAVARAIELANDKLLKQDPETKPLPHWHPNQLRHSAATEFRRRFGLEAAQVALGHSNADITQVYAERDFALAARVMGEVG